MFWGGICTGGIRCGLCCVVFYWFSSFGLDYGVS